MQSPNKLSNNTPLNIVSGLTLSSACHKNYLNTAVLDNFPIKVDIFDLQLTAHPGQIESTLCC